MKFQQQNKNRLVLISLLFAGFYLTGCNTGIDRSSVTSDNNTNSSSLDDGEPADPSFVNLNKIAHGTDTPSIVNILFQATDRDGRSVNTLSIDDFQISEDGSPLPSQESASFIVRRELMPFTLDTVIMLDISSSISSADLSNMKQAVNELVRDPSTGSSRLFAGQRVAIYSFSDTVDKIKGFSTSPAQIVRSLDNISLPISITPTDLYGALISGTDLWEVSKDITQIQDGVVILITDGSDTAGRHTISSTLNTIDAKRVITIGVGEDANEDILEQLASAGTFVVENFSELSGVLATVREQLNRYADSYYLINYASPKRAAQGKVSNSDHDFKLEVIGNNNNKSSGIIDGEFNSFNFRNITPRVVIGGTSHLEPGQSAAYLAQTYWPTDPPSYNWAFSGDCSLDRVSGDTLTISATNTGNCQISVTDDANSSVLSNISVSINSN